MESMQLGATELEVSRIGYGCMRLSDDRDEAIRTIRTALDHGITMFDHADIYGNGAREATFSAIWEEIPRLREQVVLQSKCGIRFAGDPTAEAPARYDFSYEHILRAVEGSLRRLKTDYLDVLLLHRPDPLVEPEEVARAFDALHGAGKVRAFGVSNHTPAQIELLATCVDQPLIANQVELSVVHTPLIHDGIIFNRDEDAPVSRSEGTIEYCRMHTITLQAWGPLAGGTVTGRLPTDPAIEWYIHTTLDPSLQDERGRHSAALFCQWVPYHLADGSWAEEESGFVRHLLEICDRFAPGTSDSIEDVSVLTPPAIEAHFGITAGHIHHVDNSFGFADRLPYRLSIDGLYACGAGCHPAGSVIGAAGHNAAAAVLSDLSTS